VNRSLATVVIASICAACAAGIGDALNELPPVRPGASEIQVEVYRGVMPASLPTPSQHLLIDVTPLLEPGDPPDADADLSPLAKRMVTRLELAPEPEPSKLHAFTRTGGPTDATTCESDPSRESFASAALETLATNLRSGSTLDGMRLTLATDFSVECAERLCESAARLIDEGAWLDFVQFGSGPVPTCIGKLRPTPREPASLGAAFAPSPPTFRIETALPAGAPRTLARGTAQGPPIEVGPGYRTVVVELNPEERIGPVRLVPGQRARIRLMDFPLSAPDQRQWQIEVENAAQ